MPHADYLAWLEATEPFRRSAKNKPGGEATKARYGLEHYRALGRKAQQVLRERRKPKEASDGE